VRKPIRSAAQEQTSLGENGQILRHSLAAFAMALASAAPDSRTIQLAPCYLVDTLHFWTYLLSPPVVFMLIGRRRLRLTPTERDAMRAAGRFNAQLMDYIRPFVKAGVTT